MKKNEPKTGNEPKYLSIYHQLREQIVLGILPPGSKLPSKRKMSENLNVGLITVANAYDLLLAEGYIISVERKGYFVQNISSLQMPSMSENGAQKPLKKDIDEEEEERQFFVDSKANRTSFCLFPRSTWNQLMRKTISRGNSALYSTVPYNGLCELRKSLADYLLSTAGIQCSPSQIIIGPGTEYLLFRIASLLVRTSVFGFEDPGNQKLPQVITKAGGVARSIPVDNGGLIVDALYDSDVDIMHCSPDNHFPTGIRLSAARRIELINWACQAKKRYIIEDGYDSEFLFKNHGASSLFAMDQNDKVIYMNTFSKTIVPSLRISYMVLPMSLLTSYRESMCFYSNSVSSFEQYTLAHFISEGHLNRHINRLKHHFNNLRKQLLQEIDHSPLRFISTVTEFDAGTHLLLTVRTRLCDDEIRSLGEMQNLNLQFYSDYCSSEFTMRKGVLVINYAGIDEEKITEFVQRLCSIFPECSREDCREQQSRSSGREDV